MKHSVREIILYFLSKKIYPSRSELTQLIFLTDYFFAQKNGVQYTSIQWNYGQGISMDEVTRSISSDTFSTSKKINLFGKKEHYYSYDGAAPVLTDESLLDIIDHVHDLYRQYNHSQFINLVHSQKMTKPQRQNRFRFEMTA